MRIGGAFPLTVTNPDRGGGFVSLPSGGVFYPPAGNYLFTSGGQTVVQEWDPLGQQWRGFGPPASATLQLDTDGYNWRLVNLSGTVVGASITNAGTGATNGIGAAATGVTVAFGAPAAPGVTAAAFAVVGGSVQAPTVTQAGTGYLVPPLVVIDPPPAGGIQAVAHATLTAVGGGIATIVMDIVGGGYINSPNFYLIPQPGSYQGGPADGVAAGLLPAPGQVNVLNALPANVPIAYTGTAGTILTPAALTGSGTVTGIVMTNYGSGYTGATLPAVAIVGAGAATATAIGSFVMTGTTGLAGGTNYTNPIWESSLALVASSSVGNDFVSQSARGIGTTSGGAVNALSIEFPGFGLQKVPLLLIESTGSEEATQATATAVVGGINDVSLLQSNICS
jgi:hypothetical protein